MTLEKKIVYILGMILITLQGILEFMQMNQISTVGTNVEAVQEDVGEEAIATRKEVRKSEADVIKEAEEVADQLAPVNEIIESWGTNPQAAPDPQRGLINLDKLIPPEDKAKIKQAGLDLAAIRVAVEQIAQGLAAEPLQPTAAPDEYAPTPVSEVDDVWASSVAVDEWRAAYAKEHPEPPFNTQEWNEWSKAEGVALNKWQYARHHKPQSVAPADPGPQAEGGPPQVPLESQPWTPRR